MKELREKFAVTVIGKREIASVRFCRQMKSPLVPERPALVDSLIGRENARSALELKGLPNSLFGGVYSPVLVLPILSHLQRAGKLGSALVISEQ